MMLSFAAACLALAAVGTAVPPHAIYPRQVTELPNYTKLSLEEIRHLQNRGFGPTSPTPFHQSVIEDRSDDIEDDNDDISLASTQARRPIYDDAYIQNVIPVQLRPQQRQQPQLVQRKQQQYVQQQQQHHQQQQQQNYQKLQEPEGKGKLEEEEEEEPDRLSILLPQSKFDCTGKNTGYYADEDLGCEIFHYCQDSAKHSWICPEGFTFHQVHLICMPPGGDNICAKSSQFHFVNDYLYKPVNLEEHQAKPNVSLRYSDRYYPDNYYNHNRYDEDDDGSVPQAYQAPQRKPIRVGFPQQQAPQQHQQQQQQQQVRNQQKYSPTLRPDTTIGQVFRSPEEVNISLQQRRPQYVTQRYRDEISY